MSFDDLVYKRPPIRLSLDAGLCQRLSPAMLLPFAFPLLAPLSLGFAGGNQNLKPLHNGGNERFHRLGFAVSPFSADTIAIAVNLEKQLPGSNNVFFWPRSSLE